tara:strand:- start:667 stop:1218 length:552 start_codon:yes stop_codon:yes gene_type:complete
MSDATRSPYDNQVENRNFLSPQGFKLVLNKAPKVAFFGNTANIPSMTLGTAEQANYLRNIPIPGDKIEFDDFTFRFLVDEGLENYLEIYNWIRGLGYPESLEEIFDLQSNDPEYKNPDKSMKNLYSDATLQVLTSNYNTAFKVKFKDLYPYNLSALEFDATNDDYQYFTASVSFKYTIYDIET